MNSLKQDLRYALRQLRKSPGFTAVAILMLALGIGANTAIYSLLDQVLLRGLPVREPDRLVMLSFTGSDQGRVSSRGGGDQAYFSYPMYLDLRDRNQVFEGLIATDQAQVGVQYNNQPQLSTTELVSGNYFDVLGVKPSIGRLLVPSDNQVQERDAVAVLSYSYWQRRFGADPHVVNSSIFINGHPFTVVGISQPGFKSVVVGNDTDVFVPMMMKPQVTPGWNDLENRRSRWLNIVGRLKPGMSRQQAEAGLTPLWKAIRADEQKSIKITSPAWIDRFVNKSAVQLMDGSRGFSPFRQQIEKPLWIVMGMVALVMVIACANLAGLLLVRAAGRSREMSVRYALGAKRSRIVQQLLIEGVLLGLAGAALGLVVAPQISTVLLRRMFVDVTSIPFSAALDLRVLGFNVLIGVLAGLLFSLAPALQFWKPDLAPALKQQVSTGSGRQSLLRRVFVGVQIGLSVLLLFGAGLFVRTMNNLRHVDTGIRTESLLTFTADATLAGYEIKQTPALIKRVQESLQALPGVSSVAATDDPELANDQSLSNVTVAGYNASESEAMTVERPSVTPGYFSTLGVPLLAGRTFTDADNRKDGPKVAIVNETFAKRWLGGAQHAVGGRFGHGGGPDTKTDIEIIGVAADSKHSGIRADIVPTAFTPLEQADYTGLTFYLRSALAPEQLMAAVRNVVHEIDPKLVLDAFYPMQQQIDNSLSTERLITLLASAFGGLAVLLSAIGVYGVLAYSATQRTREIGVRMALGADRITIIRLMLGEVGRLIIASVLVAIPISLMAATLLRSQLFGVSQRDPLTLLAVIVTISLVALLAAVLPAGRAAAVEPMKALRYE